MKYSGFHFHVFMLTCFIFVRVQSCVAIGRREPDQTKAGGYRTYTALILRTNGGGVESESGAKCAFSVEEWKEEGRKEGEREERRRGSQMWHTACRRPGYRKWFR